MDVVEFTARFVADLVPGANYVFDRIMPLVRDEHARRTSKALRVARQISGLDDEHLADAIRTRPELIPLFVKILNAAGSSGQDHVIDLLGARLGEAVKNADALQEKELLALALDGLTNGHISLLREYAGFPDTDPGVREAGAEPIAAYVHSTLAGKGLLHTTTGYGGGPTHYSISALARAVAEASQALDTPKTGVRSSG
jgi:hypothetical protein